MQEKFKAEVAALAAAKGMMLLDFVRLPPQSPLPLLIIGMTPTPALSTRLLCTPPNFLTRFRCLSPSLSLVLPQAEALTRPHWLRR